MRSFLFVLIATALLGGLWFIFKPIETLPPAEVSVPAVRPVKTFAIELRNRKRVAGPEVITVTQGDTVTIQIISDKADELHLHGYDLSLKIVAGVPAELSFTATQSGRFNYELHHSHHDLGVLEVIPLP